MVSLATGQGDSLPSSSFGLVLYRPILVFFCGLILLWIAMKDGMYLGVK